MHRGAQRCTEKCQARECETLGVGCAQAGGGELSRATTVRPHSPAQVWDAAREAEAKMTAPYIHPSTALLRATHRQRRPPHLARRGGCADAGSAVHDTPPVGHAAGHRVQPCQHLPDVDARLQARPPEHGRLQGHTQRLGSVQGLCEGSDATHWLFFVPALLQTGQCILVAYKAGLRRDMIRSCLCTQPPLSGGAGESHSRFLLGGRDPHACRSCVWVGASPQGGAVRSLGCCLTDVVNTQCLLRMACAWSGQGQRSADDATGHK